jgi:hypothetical protein
MQGFAGALKYIYSLFIYSTDAMQARTLVTFAVISAVLTIGALSLLAVTNAIHRSDDFLAQVFATHMDTATSDEKTVVHQGIIASSPSPQIIPRPNEHLQTVVILPYRSDGSIYKGILSFTATKPVEVTFNHRIPLDNATLSQLDMEKFGKMFIRHLTAFPGNISAIGRIIPDYSGSTSPYFSASMPFVSSSVVLRTNDEPFIAAYEVYADIVQPKVINHLENATVTNTTNASG